MDSSNLTRHIRQSNFAGEPAQLLETHDNARHEGGVEAIQGRRSGGVCLVAFLLLDDPYSS